MSTKKPQSSDKPQQMLDEVGTATLMAILTTDTRTEAAEKLQIDRATLYRRIEKYDLDKHIMEIPNQALSVLRQSSIKAAENYIKKIDHRDPRISIEASNQVLDRIGLGAKTTQNNIQNNTQFNVEFIIKE